MKQSFPFQNGLSLKFSSSFFPLIFSCFIRCWMTSLFSSLILDFPRKRRESSALPQILARPHSKIWYSWLSLKPISRRGGQSSLPGPRLWLPRRRGSTWRPRTSLRDSIIPVCLRTWVWSLPWLGCRHIPWWWRICRRSPRWALGTLTRYHYLFFIY